VGGVGISRKYSATVKGPPPPRPAIYPQPRGPFTPLIGGTVSQEPRPAGISPV
jgi:hypothetical protein